MKVPGLDERIIAHAQTLISGDDRAGETFASEPAIEKYREQFAGVIKQRPFTKFEQFACAKLGFQYISKLRLLGKNGDIILLNRWRRDSENGPWVICEITDLSGKRSPWSDIPHYSEQQRARENNGG